MASVLKYDNKQNIVILDHIWYVSSKFDLESTIQAKPLCFRVEDRPVDVISGLVLHSQLWKENHHGANAVCGVQ